MSRLYRTGVTEPTPPPDSTPEDQPDLVEVSWGALISEPSGDDSIEVDAGGVPGIQFNPKGMPVARVVFGIHREAL